MTQEHVGEHLLFPLFRCIASAYKQKYKRNIWEQFENNIRSAAYTGRLSQFYENICAIMPIEVETKYLLYIREILQSGMDKEILTWLREETAYMVLIARVKNEERKEEYAQKTEEWEENARLDAELEQEVKRINKSKKQPPKTEEVESENLFV
jgi:chorismate mutase